MNILIARTSKDIDLAFERLSSAEALGCDTETSGLSAKYGKIYSIQFSDGDFNVLVPLSERVALARLAEILTNDRIIKIFHNAKFDLGYAYAIRHHKNQLTNRADNTLIILSDKPLPGDANLHDFEASLPDGVNGVMVTLTYPRERP